MGNYFKGQDKDPDTDTKVLDRIVNDRRLELASMNRMNVTLRDAIKYVRGKYSPPKEDTTLSNSLRTGVLRYIITNNYTSITRFIRNAYYPEDIPGFDTFILNYGRQAKDTSRLLPEKTIQDSMLSFGERIDCKVLTQTVAAEIIWMIYTALNANLPKKSGRSLFKYLVDCLYNDLCQEWERTYNMTRNVVLGRLPAIFTDMDVQTGMRLALIKESGLVDARFAVRTEEAVSLSPFSERRRILQERLLKKGSDSTKETKTETVAINFAKRRLQLERCISVPNFKRS